MTDKTEVTRNFDDFVGDLRGVLEITKRHGAAHFKQEALELEQKLDTIISMLYLDLAEVSATKQDVVPPLDEFNAVQEAIIDLGKRVTAPFRDSDD